MGHFEHRFADIHATGGHCVAPIDDLLTLNRSEKKRSGFDPLRQFGQVGNGSVEHRKFTRLLSGTRMR